MSPPNESAKSVSLVGLDFAVIMMLGIGSITVLAALTHVTVLEAFLTAGAFVILSVIFRRLSARSDKSLQTADQKVTPQRAAYIGEARLANGFAEAIIIIGKNERIEYANPAAQILLGVEKAGGSLTSVVRDPAVIDMVSRVFSQDKVDPVTYHVESPMDRHFRTMAARIESSFDEEAPRRALIVFYDITDIVRSNDMRSDFLANASHELKTPVASLLGYIETLRGHAKNDAAARDRFLTIMQTQAERMQRLIEDLLSLRRIEMSEHIQPTETALLYGAVRAAFESVAPLAAVRNVKLRFEGPRDASVVGFQDDLVQLVLNLVDNAVHISPEGSEVVVELDHLTHWQHGHEFEAMRLGAADVPRRRICTPAPNSGAYWRLRIRDYGPGFAREHLPRLGERFYRIAGDRTSQMKGTGLGLAIVKHIILRHRGGLYIESAKDVGTEFTLLLQDASILETP